jgi:hypothetical protein
MGVKVREHDRFRELFAGIKKTSRKLEALDTPERVEEIFDREIPSGHPKRARAEIVINQYKKYYEKATTLLRKRSRTVFEQIGLSHWVNKLINLHPYATYAYKAQGASKKALKAKGERTGKIMIDLSRNPFSDKDAAKAYAENMTVRIQHFLGLPPAPASQGGRP